MSAPSAQVDWPGIRAAAVAVGVREAARRAAADLPPDERARFVQRVMKRCSRERWLANAAAHREQPRTVNLSKPLSAAVRSGAEALADTLAGRRDETRLGLSKYAARVSSKAGEDGELGDAQQLAHVAKIAGHVWPKEMFGDGAGGNVAIQVNIG